MKVEVDLLEHYFPESPAPSNNGDNRVNNPGRPRKGEEKNNEKWQPKEWNVEYEKIVMMDLMGLKGVEIAEKTGYTPQHVYNILSTDEAIAIQRAMLGRVKEETFSIIDELKEIEKLTVKRLKSCLKNDEVFATSRLGFISKGIDVMKGRGEHIKHAPTNQVQNNFMLPPSVAERLAVGLEKSNEARKLLSSSNEGRNLGDQ